MISINISFGIELIPDTKVQATLYLTTTVISKQVKGSRWPFSWELGEKIGSLHQYRQWLRDQAKFRKKAAWETDPWFLVSFHTKIKAFFELRYTLAVWLCNGWTVFYIVDQTFETSTEREISRNDMENWLRTSLVNENKRNDIGRESKLWCINNMATVVSDS